jgi:cytochrome P450 family 110
MLPGPKSTLLATLGYLRDPYASLAKNAKRYGDLHASPSVFGRMVVTGHPDGVREIFSADPAIFEPLGKDMLAPILGETSIIVLSGEPHRRMRKLQMPPFHGARMRAYGQIIIDTALRHASAWKPGERVAVYRAMQKVSLDVILEAVLGLQDEASREAFARAVIDAIEALKPSFMFMPALRRDFLGLSAWSRFQRRKTHVSELFTAELDRRRRTSEPREDILSLLMAARDDENQGLGDDDLLVQMMNLIVAGHETTASSLAWAFELIHRTPEVKARLQDELRAAGDDPAALAALPYLEAVCSETLRINPVAPVIGRKLLQPFTLQGEQIPAGGIVGISVHQLHRRADVYPEPEQFRPERFLDRTFTPFEWLPFGGGARRCIGAAFAMYEMKLVLAAILRRFDLRLVNTVPVTAAARNTTVGPKREIELVF